MTMSKRYFLSLLLVPLLSYANTDPLQNKMRGLDAALFDALA